MPRISVRREGGQLNLARKATTVDLTPAQRQRQRVATLSRHRPDSTELVDARRDLAAANLASQIERVVAEAPPLTQAQRDQLASLLRPIPTAGAAARGTALQVDNRRKTCAEPVGQTSTGGGVPW